ncbi:zinc finger BED domain-containing protein 6-like [Perognathus longimembris pacificus]|uniref:zinc finger BED domain-containing protein 6-like n=1 Tax=Perognathus longimembris pacificus TaxID=214514 RepID=UPI00201A22B1|nr:zinc finger BED domain-containing protein 6-like [Perognathus longimembris pacificus]
MLEVEKVQKTPKKQPPSEPVGQELFVHANSPATPACPYSDSNTKATNTPCRLGQAGGEGLPDIGVKLELVDLEEKADGFHKRKIRPFGSQKKHEKDLTLQRSSPYPRLRETLISFPGLNQVSLEKQAESTLDLPARSRKRKSHSLSRPGLYPGTSCIKCPNSPGQSKSKGDSGTHGHKLVPRQEYPARTMPRLEACGWREGERAGKITLGCAPSPSAKGQPVPQAPQVVRRDRSDRLEVSQSGEQEETRQADTLTNHLVTDLQPLRKLKKKHLLPGRREKAGTQAGTQGLDSTPHPPGLPHTMDPKPNLDIRQFFTIDLKKACRILCVLCHSGVKRGRTMGWSRVSGLVRHLASKHGLEWERRPGAGARGLEQAQLRALPIGSPLCASRKHSDMASSEGSDKEPAAGDPERPPPLPAPSPSPASPDAVKDTPGGSQPGPCTPAWNHSITELLCSLALPFSFVFSQPFKRFLAQVDPGYRLPSPGFFSTKALPLLREAVGEQLLREMQWAEGGHVHFTFFMSAHDSAVTYVAIAAHWVSAWSPNGPGPSGGQRRQAVLWARGLTGERVGEERQRELLEQIRLWLGRGALRAGFLVSGGRPSLEHLVRAEGYSHIPCFAHCLDSLVNNFLCHHNSVQIILGTARAIFSHFQGSPEARRLLAQLQEQFSLPSQRPFEELSDHWVSAYQLMEWVTEQKQALQAYAEKQQSGKASTTLSAMFWSLTDSLVKLLQPFQMVLCEASAAQASLSQVLPQLRYLHIFLEQVRRHFTQQGGGEAAVALRLAEGLALQLSTDRQLDELFHREEFVLATLLDPRFKGKVEAILPAGADIDHWKQVLVYKVKEIMVSEGPLPAFSRLTNPRGTRGGRIARSLGARGRGHREPVQGAGDPSPFLLVQKEKSLLEQLESVGLLASERNGASLPTENHLASVIVRKYLRENETIGAQQDPLAYWEKKREAWPALARLATVYLSCPPTGAFSERVLAALNSPTIAEANPPLQVETVEHLLFLKANLESFPHYTPPPLISSPDLAEGEQTL